MKVLRLRVYDAVFNCVFKAKRFLKLMCLGPSALNIEQSSVRDLVGLSRRAPHRERYS